MPVIDIHEHVIPRRGFMHPQRGETITTAAELVAIMDRKGIDRSVVLPLSSPETYHFVQSNEEVLEACAQFPERLIFFCNVDPRLESNNFDYDFVPILAYYKALGARGVGEVVCNLWWHDPRVQNLLRDCAKVGLPFLFHLATREFGTYGLITRPGLIELERALDTHPQLAFLGHSQPFWAEVGPTPNEAERAGYPRGKVLPGGRVPALMRKYKNLRGDLSAGSGHNALARDPEWAYEFLDEFQDQLLMGNDVCIPSNDQCELVDFLREGQAKGRISEQVFNKVMGDNAVKLLGLE